MPQVIQCPRCRASLKLPDEHLGTEVSCPECQATFTAAPPVPKRRPPEEDDYDYDDDRRGRGPRLGPDARALVSGPSTFLIVTAVLDMLTGLGAMGIGVLFLVMAGSGGPGFSPSDRTMFQTLGIVYPIIGLIALVKAIVVLLGAMRMKSLTSYGFAMTAAIAALIPMGLCSIIGIIAGIWSLVTLLKSEVKEAFR